MKINKIKILFLVIILVIIGLVSWFGYNFAPGTYPYAEVYELNYSEEKVKSAINKFKQEHPEYIVPKVTMYNNQNSWDLTDEQSKEPSHWYGVYFYYKNKILFTWTRSAGENKTTFAFVSINDGLELGHWKRINKDFSSSENEKLKEEFEEEILKKVKENLGNVSN